MMVVGVPRLQRMIAPPIGHFRGPKCPDRVLANDNFTRLFRARTGLTPALYRQSYAGSAGTS